jgi:hypothetical protein
VATGISGDEQQRLKSFQNISLDIPWEIQEALIEVRYAPFDGQRLRLNFVQHFHSPIATNRCGESGQKVRDMGLGNMLLRCHIFHLASSNVLVS